MHNCTYKKSGIPRRFLKPSRTVWSPSFISAPFKFQVVLGVHFGDTRTRQVLVVIPDAVVGQQPVGAAHFLPKRLAAFGVDLMIVLCPELAEGDIARLD